MCNAAPAQVITRHLDNIKQYLSNIIEKYEDQITSSKLVHVLTTPIVNVDLSAEVGFQIYTVTCSFNGNDPMAPI